GTSRAAISDTLKIANSPPMDRKLAVFARELRGTMANNITELESLEVDFGGQSQRPDVPKISLRANVAVSTVYTDVSAKELEGWRVDLTFHTDSHFLALRNEDIGISIGITEDEFLVLDDHGEKIIRYKTLRAALD